METRVTKVEFKENKLFFLLEDGREVGCPLEWFPKLWKATDEQRNKYRILPHGIGVHWEDLDEDISTEGMFKYSPPLKAV